MLEKLGATGSVDDDRRDHDHNRGVWADTCLDIADDDVADDIGIGLTR